MPSFARFFTPEAFRAIYDLDQTRPRDSDPDAKSAEWHKRYDVWRNEYQQCKRDNVTPALAAFLERLREEGRLHPIAHSDGYRTNFLSAWNTLATGEPLDTYRLDSIAYQITSRPIFNAIYLSDGVPPRSEEEIQQQYDKLVAQVDSGNFDWDSMGDHECFKTGLRGHIEFKDWQGIYGTLDHDKGWDLIPAPPLAPDSVQTAKLTLPSGRLLVADWFRIEAFTAATKAGADDFEINSEAGCIKATRWYAEKLGFVSVFVGNSSPQILRRGNTLTAGGWRDEEAELAAGDSDATHYESICTDLWWATMIDYQQLVHLVASQAGEGEAQQLVDAYLAEDHYGLQEISMPPGEYTLHFAGNHHKFDALLQADEITRNEVEPFFALSDRDLTLQNAAKPVKRKKVAKP